MQPAPQLSLKYHLKQRTAFKQALNQPPSKLYPYDIALLNSLYCVRTLSHNKLFRSAGISHYSLCCIQSLNRLISSRYILRKPNGYSITLAGRRAYLDICETFDKLLKELDK